MISFGPAGLAIDNFETILSEVQTDFRNAYGVSVATELKSSAGQMQRILALREQQWHERTLDLYQSLDPRLAEA